MSFNQSIERISSEYNRTLIPEEIEEITFLLENDVSLFHLSKSNLEEAIHEAILYITPDY